MRSVGLDLALGKIVFCEVAGGCVVKRATVREVDELQGLLGPARGKASVAVEASRSAWHVCDWLKARGHEAVLVDTTKLAQIGIGDHGRKTDRIDAEVLARSIEKGTTPRAHQLSPARRLLRDRLNQRGLLVRTRASLIVAARGIARSQGVRLPIAGTEDFARAMKDAKLDDALATELAPMIAVVTTLDAQIATLDTRLVEICKNDRAMQICATAPGVGLIVGAAFVCVIDDPSRFKNAHQVEAYIGLVPREDSSRTRRKLGSITKEGNAYLRTMLVQAAWTILRSKGADDPLVEWAHQLKRRRKGAIASIAVARRLAGILYAIWKKDRPYDPAWLAHQSADGKHVEAAWTEAQASRFEAAGRKLAGRAIKKIEPLTRSRIEPKSRTASPRKRRVAEVA